MGQPHAFSLTCLLALRRWPESNANLALSPSGLATDASEFGDPQQRRECAQLADVFDLAHEAPERVLLSSAAAAALSPHSLQITSLDAHLLRPFPQHRAIDD